MISCYLGVTEPAMFGINIKYIYPFVGAMVGSGLAGFVSVLTGVTAASIGVGGIPGFLSIQFEHWPMFFVAMGIAIVVPFLLTVLFEKKGILVPKGEIDALQKLFTTIKGKELDWSYIVRIIREFIQYVKDKDIELAKDLAEIADEYINDKRRSI